MEMGWDDDGERKRSIPQVYGIQKQGRSGEREKEKKEKENKNAKMYKSKRNKSEVQKKLTEAGRKSE